MQIADLQPNQRIFKVTNSHNHVLWYDYMCPHPHNKEYHILIDQFEDPVRMYKTKLQEILDLNLNSYEEARLCKIKLLKEQIKSWQEKD